MVFYEEMCDKRTIMVVENAKSRIKNYTQLLEFNLKI